LNWTCLRFGQLSLDDLYDALALRCRVFVLEQGPFLDPDGVDRDSAHVLGRDGAGVLQAYLRIVDPGVKYAEPSIGRVITSPETRGTGLGRQLMAEGVARCLVAWAGHTHQRAVAPGGLLQWLRLRACQRRLPRGRHAPLRDAARTMKLTP
jgi:ElaA protein